MTTAPLATSDVTDPTPATPPSPRLELDLDVALLRFHALRDALPSAAIHYAVKANPHPLLLRRLNLAGSRFDVASPAEVCAAMAAGAGPADMVYSNPIKLRAHIADAFRHGVRLFVVDTPAEVHKVAEVAPGAAVLARLATSGAGSDWPLSRKFGCPGGECVHLLRVAAQRGLLPAGISFHVGSQQRDPMAWCAPIEAAGRVFRAVRRAGLAPDLLDLGGGFPAHHQEPHPSFGHYGRVIEAALESTFGANRPRIMVEPGRGISGDAGTVVTSVVGVVHRGGQRWVFLDAGVFTGLVETWDESIRYRLATSVDGGPTGPAVLAGPTCDSADVLYEKNPVELPLALAEGDEVRLLSAGAYTSCYSTVGFNGFPPLPTVLVSGTG